MISDLHGSLGYRYFLNIANETKCFTSCACVFERGKTSDQPGRWCVVVFKTVNVRYTLDKSKMLK